QLLTYLIVFGQDRLSSIMLHDYEKLELVYFGKIAGITSIPKKTFKNLPALKIFAMHNNTQLQKIEDDAFSLGNNLEVLDLGFNAIKTIGKNAFNVGDSTKNTILYLDENQLEEKGFDT